MGGIPAFSAAIISDLTTRILTPVGTGAAGENKLVIETNLGLNIGKAKEIYRNAYIWAKEQFEEKHKDQSRK